MRSLAITIAASVLLATLVCTAGVCEVPGEIVIWGDDSDKPVTDTAAYDPTMAEIIVNGALFFRIRTPAAGYSVAQRERIVQTRIVEIFSSCDIAPVYVSKVRGKPTIYVGRHRLVTVYPQDAAACGGTTPRRLAKAWAINVRKALQQTAPSRCFADAPPDS